MLSIPRSLNRWASGLIFSGGISNCLIKYSDTLLYTWSSRIHHTIEARVTIAEMSDLEFTKIKNPSSDLITETGIPKGTSGDQVVIDH
jgi:hypothetical protein